MVTRLEIKNAACRCVQDLLERCQRGRWKTGEHGLAIVQTTVNDNAISRLNGFINGEVEYYTSP